MGSQPDTTDVVAEPIEVAEDLAHFHRDIRPDLPGIDGYVVAEAILVAVMLAGDAVRNGAPSVLLRVRPLGDNRVRVEVTCRRPSRTGPPAHRGRGRLLDQVSERRGVSESTDGRTTIWADLTPSR